MILQLLAVDSSLDGTDDHLDDCLLLGRQVLLHHCSLESLKYLLEKVMCATQKKLMLNQYLHTGSQQFVKDTKLPLHCANLLLSGVAMLTIFNRLCIFGHKFTLGSEQVGSNEMDEGEVCEQKYLSNAFVTSANCVKTHIQQGYFAVAC